MSVSFPLVAQWIEQEAVGKDLDALRRLVEVFGAEESVLPLWTPPAQCRNVDLVLWRAGERGVSAARHCIYRDVREDSGHCVAGNPYAHGVPLPLLFEYVSFSMIGNEVELNAECGHLWD